MKCLSTTKLFENPSFLAILNGGNLAKLFSSSVKIFHNVIFYYVYFSLVLYNCSLLKSLKGNTKSICVYVCVYVAICFVLFPFFDIIIFGQERKER